MIKTVVRAAVYARISQDVTGEELGVARQREDCLALAKQLGWKVVEVYVDNDTSASSGKRRPAYERMLAGIRGGQVDAVICWAPDRLYRRLRDLEPLIETFEKHDTVFKTVRGGGFDMGTPTGRMIARILASVATGEVEVKSDRWARSWRQQRERGAPVRTGSRLFGYDRDCNIIPAEAAIARRMADDLINGASILSIARWLEAQGILATRGKPWRPAGVRTYLTNPRIAGYSTLKGEIVCDAQWEPILDRDTWETVKAILDARTREAPPRRSVLNGLIFCGGCGHRLITGAGNGKRTYRCPNRPGLHGCGKVSGTAEAIEAVVETYAQQRLADPRVRGQLDRMATAPGSAPLLTQIVGLQKRMAELEAQLEEPGVPVATLMRAIERTRERLEATRLQLAHVVDAAHVVHTGGKEWPAALADRRRAISLALEGRRVFLDPAAADWVNIRGFDSRRVRVALPPQ